MTVVRIKLLRTVKKLIVTSLSFVFRHNSRSSKLSLAWVLLTPVSLTKLKVSVIFSSPIVLLIGLVKVTLSGYKLTSVLKV
jgi:hypothetical protein